MMNFLTSLFPTLTNIFFNNDEEQNNTMAMQTSSVSDMLGTEDWDGVAVPDFEGRKVYVLPGAFYGNCVSLFATAGFEKAEKVEDADVVVFIGGADVDPSLYNQETMSTSSFNRERDDLEQEIYEKCVDMGKIMVGICRGAQFLHVMNGGELWQDVENHAGNDHYIVDIEEDVRVQANSYHHQMLMLNSNIEILAVCEDQISSSFKSPDLFLDLKKEGSNANAEIEIEAGYYSNTQCFFVQGHPEVGCDAYKSWVMTKFHDLLIEWEQET